MHRTMMIGWVLLARLALTAAEPAPAADRFELNVFEVPALSAQPLLPGTPTDGFPKAECLEVTATPGEYEPAAVALTGKREFKQLQVEISPLRDGDGHALPASAVDCRLVKCWYQAGSAWCGVGQDRDRRKLVPELLLHDSDLVRVDTVRETQSVRLGGPGSQTRLDASDPTPVAGSRWDLHYPIAGNDIRDAKTLQPFDLAADTVQELFFTCHVPEDAEPGMYRGNVRILEGKDAVAEFALSLRVLPFRLAAPATAYDPDLPFTASIYYVNILDPEHPELNPMYRNREEYRAELLDLKAHGILNPFCYQLTSWDTDRFRQVLQLRKELGMINRPLYTFPEANLGVNFRNDPESLAEVKAKVSRILDIAEEELGHRDVYFYGVDETDGDRLRQEFPIWQAIHEAGGKVFVSDCSRARETRDIPGDLLDVVVVCGDLDQKLAAHRHDLGGKIWSYGNPQGGVENPDAYRRNYGLKLWLDDYDGFATYCYFESFGHPWNDFDGTPYRDHNLVYPTADGVVDTVAWEGYREAIDDIRYATTLRLAIRDAGPTAATVAAEAQAWLDRLDPDAEPAPAIRLRMIDYILRIKSSL